MRVADRASFRDPAGFVYIEEGEIYRSVSKSYLTSYREFMSSGLFQDLVGEGLLVRHTECANSLDDDYPVVLKPEKIEPITYPYEWCFSQLKDAALLTLAIQKKAMSRGMSLRDASAFNVQFVSNRPVFIDTLSFGALDPRKPWGAYRQFCQHFLAPLALMSYVSPDLNRLIQLYIDGVPLQLASRMLPASSWARFGLFSHIHMHARLQQSAHKSNSCGVGGEVSLNGLFGILDSLRETIEKLEISVSKTEWEDYYSATNYTSDSLLSKEEGLVQLVRLAGGEPLTILDLGSNNGRFSRHVAPLATRVFSVDRDPKAVDSNYRACMTEGIRNVLPLVLDVTNLPGGVGWDQQERKSVLHRLRPDITVSLALIHHLVIGSNIPFTKVAEFLARVSDAHIIEFVPKSDSQVQLMLKNREDIFGEYTFERFMGVFGAYFEAVGIRGIVGSQRKLILFRRKGRSLREFHA